MKNTALVVCYELVGRVSSCKTNVFCFSEPSMLRGEIKFDVKKNATKSWPRFSQSASSPSSPIFPWYSEWIMSRLILREGEGIISCSPVGFADADEYYILGS